MDFGFPAIDFPSIAEGLRIMNWRVSHASRLLPDIRKASISLVKTIRVSNFVDLSVSNHEVIALKQSVHNLERSFEVAISEVQRKIALFETALRINTRSHFIDCR